MILSYLKEYPFPLGLLAVGVDADINCASFAVMLIIVIQIILKDWREGFLPPMPTELCCWHPSDNRYQLLAK